VHHRRRIPLRTTWFLESRAHSRAGAGRRVEAAADARGGQASLNSTKVGGRRAAEHGGPSGEQQGGGEKPGRSSGVPSAPPQFARATAQQAGDREGEMPTLRCALGEGKEERRGSLSRTPRTPEREKRGGEGERRGEREERREGQFKDMPRSAAPASRAQGRAERIAAACQEQAREAASWKRFPERGPQALCPHMTAANAGRPTPKHESWMGSARGSTVSPWINCSLRAVWRPMRIHERNKAAEGLEENP
jgi:hypothetical protein